MNLIQIYKERNKIIEGLKNKIFKKEHIEIIYNERMSICLECDSLDIEGKNCTVPGTQPCCSECGCSLGLKGRSLSSECPLDKWKAVVNNFESMLINKSIQLNDEDETNDN